MADPVADACAPQVAHHTCADYSDYGGFNDCCSHNNCGHNCNCNSVARLSLYCEYYPMHTPLPHRLQLARLK